MTTAVRWTAGGNGTGMPRSVCVFAPPLISSAFDDHRDTVKRFLEIPVAVVPDGTVIEPGEKGVF